MHANACAHHQNVGSSRSGPSIVKVLNIILMSGVGYFFSKQSQKLHVTYSFGIILKISTMFESSLCPFFSLK